MATFSSRGPGDSSGGDLLKPDIMAPGVDVVAATGPESHNGNLWDTNSGTSMASPHIAGIGALIMAKHPNWSPMMVKSALMTTAGVRDNEGQPIQDQADASNATPLEMGAGQVAANEAFDPGLVYDAGITQWLQYSLRHRPERRLRPGASATASARSTRATSTTRRSPSVTWPASRP